MKKKRSLMIGAQVALVLGFSFSFYQYVQNEVQPREVYVFNKDLPANTLITKADVTKVTIPSKAITSDFALDSKDIVGKYVTTKVFSNQFVYKKQLVKKDHIDPFDSMDMSKLRKITIPVNYIDSFSGNIKRGDKVDLLFVGEGKKQTSQGEQSFKYSKVFLQNVYVYSVNTEKGFKYVDHSMKTKDEIAGAKSEGEKISTTDESNDIASVTLAVTLDQAEEIEARMSSGQVKLVGRFDESQSYETLGFVLGEFGKVFAEKSNAETGRATINEDQQFQK